MISKRERIILITNKKVADASLDSAAANNVGERTTNAEGVFPLCAGDRILVIVSLIMSHLKCG